ncbi:MAG TPA: RES domain-containing protein [Trueperaceae bacterium]|nr:RES domain-containing protein [Trueperaceae bacterium]
MRAWRVFDHNRDFARFPDFDPLDGEGGLHEAGTWNLQGNRIVYASSTSSLAIIERLVHVTPRAFGEQMLLELEIPDDTIEVVSPRQFAQHLRDGRNHSRASDSQRFGTAWLVERRSVTARNYIRLDGRLAKLRDPDQQGEDL